MAEASSDSDYTNEQMARFKSLLKRVRQAGIAVPTISTDNSAALLTTNLNHFNPTELLVQKNDTNSLGYVRTGGGIFGQRPAFPQLKPVSTLTASVSHVAVLEEGQSVGYDRAYIAGRSVRIATLTIGFADGYPRDLGNGRGKVSIRGKTFPVAGKVCMDMMMVDLGSAEDVDSVGAKVCVGDRAVLWGPEEENGSEGQIRLQDIAEELNTTQSALTCGLNKVRVQRQYID
jgi:alanine racemase